jgi:DNA-binding PadR family transcriptional regulator
MNLRAVILVLLSKQPNTGYGIGRLLRRELSHLWAARLQQIYSELAKLESEGLVAAACAQDSHRPATPAGESALDCWLAADPAPLHYRDDLLVRLYCLERLPTDLPVRRLEERRDEATRRVVELRQQLAEAGCGEPPETGHLLALDAALARATSHAEWAARAITALRKRSAGAQLTTASPLS